MIYSGRKFHYLTLYHIFAIKRVISFNQLQYADDKPNVFMCYEKNWHTFISTLTTFR